MSIYSDIDALVASVNDGDKDTILILADAVEESGNEKTAIGLRLASLYSPRDNKWRRSRQGHYGTYEVPEVWYYRMCEKMGVGGREVAGGICGGYGTFRSADGAHEEYEDTVWFPILCDAYVALADAIMECQK